MERHIKQAMIGTAYLIIFGVLIFFISWKLFLSDGPCTADCPLSDITPLELEEKVVGRVHETSYDLVARIRNPNPQHQAVVTYAFVIAGERGLSQEVFTGKTTILPNQSKYIVAPNIGTLNGTTIEITPSEFSLEYKNLSWELFDGDIPVLGTLSVSYERTEDSRGTFGTVTGSLINNTPHAYNSVKVIAMLYNEHQELITASFTTVRDVGARGQKSFAITWSNPTFGKPADIIVEAYPD